MDRDSSTDDGRRDGDRGTIERRGVLAALATGLGGAGLARSSLAREVGIDALDRPQFVVEQGGECVPITPLSGEETVEQLYDYRTPNTDPSGATYSSYGTTDLQRPETSIVFLYDGPEGLSLVVVHDKLEDGTNGGAVTFDLGFSHPDRGEWVVGDDIYDGPTNYDSFAETADGWRVDWTWGDGRTDGGAYRPLGDDFAVTIDPKFNEAATLYGEHYEGEITDWQLLSGDRSAPERVPLRLDRPITIRAGTCGGTTTTTQRTTTRKETTTEETTTEEETTAKDEEQSSGPISADVEILPGKVNPRSHGRLPVVVHSEESFDATAIAPGSVAFGPASARPAKRIPTDHDGDGRTDLKLHFWMDALDGDWDTDRLKLTAETEDGRKVVASTDLELVPNGGDGDDEDDDDENEDESEGRRGDDGDDDDRWDRDDEEDAEDDSDDEDEGDVDEEDDDDGSEGDEDGEDDEDEDDENEGKDDEDDDDEERGRGNGRGRGRGDEDEGDD